MESSSLILVVDDDTAVRKCTAAMLSHFGYQVHTVDDGSAGLEAVTATRYDLVITDNLMKEMSGREMVKAMREAGFGLPVIMITGELSQHEVRRNPWLDASIC